MTSDSTFSNQSNSVIKVLTALVAAINKVAIISAPTAGAVGSYMMAKSTVVVASGGTVAGGALTPSNAAGTSVGAALSGTWICMGTIGTTGDVSLFVRSA